MSVRLNLSGLMVPTPIFCELLEISELCALSTELLTRKVEFTEYTSRKYCRGEYCSDGLGGIIRYRE